MYVQKNKLLIVLVTAVLLTITACSNSDSKQSTASNTSTSESAMEDGPLVKYDPPIELRSVKAEVDKSLLQSGDTTEENVWTRAYSKDLGIDIKYDWIVAPGNVNDKMNVTLASGDLPDLMTVTTTQLKQLIDADKVEDLTEVYNKYATPLLKKYVEADDKIGMKSVTINDKLYGIPNYTGILDNAPVLWIRSDWMKKLNLQAPKTTDDLIAIAKAFVEQDPDGNGKNDTQGLILSKGLQQESNLQPTGFFNGFHAQLGIWVKASSGKYVYSSTQPQVKEALYKMQQMYKDGLIDKEFGTKDVAKAFEAANANKAGMFFGPMYAPFQVGELVGKDKSVDWAAFPIVSADGKPVLAQEPAPNSNSYVVRKGYEHPEALIKLLNFQVDKMYGENSATERKKYTGDNDQGWQGAVVSILPPNKNTAAQEHITEALKSKDPSKLNVEEKGYYDNILKFRDGDRSQWWNERIFGPDSSQAVLKYYRDNNLLINDAFIYAPTDAMDSKKATLDKLELETFTKIIYGASSIDDFDKFVSDWKKLGGDAITEEVNTILSK